MKPTLIVLLAVAAVALGDSEGPQYGQGAAVLPYGHQQPRYDHRHDQDRKHGHLKQTYYEPEYGYKKNILNKPYKTDPDHTPVYEPNPYRENSYEADPYHTPVYKPDPYHQKPSYKPDPYHQKPSYKPDPYHHKPSYKPDTYNEPSYKPNLHRTSSNEQDSSEERKMRPKSKPSTLPKPAFKPTTFHGPELKKTQQTAEPESSYEKKHAPKYTYDYTVEDKDTALNFKQQESRDGYNTQGAYYVALPDGRRQKVTYYVDGDSGFVAEVSYEGEAHYSGEKGYKKFEPQSIFIPKHYSK